MERGILNEEGTQTSERTYYDDGESMGDSTHQMTESVAVAGADYPTVEQEAAHASPSLPSADTKKERERARKKAQRSKKRTQLATKRQEAAAAAVSEGAAAAVESQVERTS